MLEKTADICGINLVSLPREAESRYRGYRRYREANDPKGKKYQKRQKMILCFPKDTNCGRNNSQGEKVVACVCEITIKGLSGKSLRIFFQFSKIFQGSLKMLFCKPYQPSGIKMRNIVDQFDCSQDEMSMFFERSLENYQFII